MKKAKIKDDEMRAEYRREDLGPLVRGKYAAEYAKATNVVVIDPKLTKVFPDSASVNAALRSVVEFANLSAELTQRTGGRAGKRRAA
jgi:hypothetical protein